MAMKLIRGLNECGKIFSVIFLFRAVGFESQTWRDDIFLSLSFQCRILFWPPSLVYISISSYTQWIALYCKDLKHIGHVIVSNIWILLIYHSNLYVNALPGLDLNPGPAMDPCMNLFMKSCRQKEIERSEVAHPGQGANQNLGPLE